MSTASTVVKRAALAATVITYRPRSALPTSPGPLVWAPSKRPARESHAMVGWSAAIPQRVRDAGFDPGSPWLARLLPLANEL